MGNPRIAGRLTLLVFMVVFSVGLIAATGATIAFAARPAPGTASPPSPPMILPGVAVSGPGAAPGCDLCRNWIVGASPGRITGRIAATHGADPITPGLGIYRIERGSATRFARALRRSGRLTFAEPDTAVAAAGYPPDTRADEQSWLSQIVNPLETTPPEINAGSPPVAVVEKGMDPAHPDLVKANLADGTPTGDVDNDAHGTAVAGILGSPGEGAGIRGVLPGAQMRHFPSGETCSTAAGAVTAAARAGASVINMSYTFPSTACYSHYLATEYAVSRDVLPVAAAGNDALIGNPRLGPAIHPHVISVAAVNGENRHAKFSTFNRGVDLSAPGVDVLAPWVKAGPAGSDGIPAEPVPAWAKVSGTSFAAPMVSAAAAWIRQGRPGLSGYQAGKVLTGSATDLGRPGRDVHYGSGLLNIDAALIAPRPVNDAMEPNEDIPIIRGSAGISRARYLWKPAGRRVVKLRATLSRAKDPADVYRVRIPARGKIMVTAAQLEGDVRVTALKPSTRTLDKLKRKVIVRSDRPFPKTEGIKVRNLRRKAADIWLAVTPGRHDRAGHSTYRLTVRRTR